MKFRFAIAGSALLAIALTIRIRGLARERAVQEGQGRNARCAAPAQPQKLDEEYTKLIKEYLQDPRITTELVDHMPASDTVPSPLKFLGRIPGKPGELTYAKDIDRYYEALAKASPRAKYLEDRHHRGRPRHRRARHRRRADHQGSRQVQGHAGQARRSAQDHRGAGARADPHRQADLLDQQRHPLARNRRTRDADRAGLPPDHRRDAIHPADPQQRDYLHHARARSRWPRARSGHLLLRQGDRQAARRR